MKRQPKVMPKPKFNDVAYFARELGVSESFVRKLAEVGEIRSIRLLGRILIPIDEGERLQQKSLREPPQ